MRIILIILTAFAFVITQPLFAAKEEKIENPTVKLITNYGDMVIELYPDKTPETVKNFLAYVDAGFYDKTIFHRVINGFMIQGGGFELKGDAMMQKPTSKPIANEADKGIANDRGTISMARTSDPHSATGQFFINQKDNTFLNHKNKSTQGWGYCAFGKVTEGIDVVDKIAGVKTGTSGGHGDVPLKAVILEKVVRVSKQ